MAKTLPVAPLNQEHLLALIAVLILYQQYRRGKTPLTDERSRTLLILEGLIPRLSRGVNIPQGTMPLWITVDEVQVMKSGLATLIDLLQRKPVSTAISKEIQQLEQLKTLIEQTFGTTHDETRDPLHHPG